MHEEVEKLVENGAISQDSAEKLDKISPGKVVSHRSWGIGQVKSWDLEAHRIVINFEGNPEHEMRLAFAIKSLDSFPEEHIYYRWFNEQEEVQRVALENQELFIEEILLSFDGKLGVKEFEHIVRDRIIPEDSYKAWWEKAKRKLRKNSNIILALRKNQTLELQGDKSDFKSELIEEYLSSKDIKGKTLALNSIVKHGDIYASNPADLKPVIDELQVFFARRKSIAPENTIEFLNLRAQLRKKVKGLHDLEEGKEDDFSAEKFLRENSEKLCEILNCTTATGARKLLSEAPKVFGEAWFEDAILPVLDKGSGKGVEESAKFALQNEKEKELRTYLEKNIERRSLNPDLICWVCKERKQGLQDIIDDNFLQQISHLIDNVQLDDTKSSSGIANLLNSDGELIADLLKACDPKTAIRFAGVIKQSPHFEDLTRKSLLARMVKVHKDVQKFIFGEHDKKRRDKHLFVSHESLEKRKKDYKELVNKKIPENSKDIATARSYGDLRENFEYKSAKEMQTVLHQRKAEMEKELNQARAINFNKPNTDKVSIGVIVELSEPSGKNKQSYTVLGAWDSEPKKHIIPYTSKIGKMLLNKKVGEKVILPEKENSIPLVIKKITAYEK